MEQVGKERNLQEKVVVKPYPPILLFDGLCHFCDATVQFVFRKDKSQSIHFASLQSEFGQNQLRKANLSPKDLETLIFIENGQLYTHSTGALRMSRYLGEPWSLAYGFIIIPSPIRNFFYRLIARNRYRLFGKKSECELPSKEMRSRFIS